MSVIMYNILSVFLRNRLAFIFDLNWDCSFICNLIQPWCKHSYIQSTNIGVYLHKFSTTFTTVLMLMLRCGISIISRMGELETYMDEWEPFYRIIYIMYAFDTVWNYYKAWLVYVSNLNLPYLAPSKQIQLYLSYYNLM